MQGIFHTFFIRKYLVGVLFNLQDLFIFEKKLLGLKKDPFLDIHEKKNYNKNSGLVALITVFIGTFHHVIIFTVNTPHFLPYTPMLI